METCEVRRNLGHFKLDLWGGFFTSFIMDSELLESYTKEVEELKEEVTDELVAVGVKVSEKMILINTLERLGVYYLFTKEIEEQLDLIIADYTDMNIDYDLYTTALHFRIFRQHGYKVSSDVFNKFKDNSGAFKESLMSDLDGILSLYEATYLMVNGEEILDDALAFTKAHLKSIASTLSPNMAEQVKHALEQSLHRSTSRMEARNYISKYEMDSSRNEKLLRLAKVDFNRIQLLHKEELCGVSRWWENLISETPYVRDRIVEIFLWATLVHFEPEYSFLRVSLAKTIGLLTTVDDSYDAYGTRDEVLAFTEAIQSSRWERSAIDQIPEYLKPVYSDILSYHDNLTKELEKKGTTYALPYFIEEFQEIVKAWDKESEWLNKGYVPSFDEYMAVKLKNGADILVTVSFTSIGEVATPQALEWMRTENGMVKACTVISRLGNDLAGYKVEQQREHAASAVECYMKQYNVTEQEAIDEIYKMVEKAWLTLNEELLRTTIVSKPLLMIVLSHARVYTELYFKKFDRLTEPEGFKNHIISMFVNPIPL